MLVACIWATRRRGSLNCDGSGGRWQWRGGRVVIGDALKQPVKVVSGESPVERLGDGVVAVFEGGEAVGDPVEVDEVVGGDDFALDDGEHDLDPLG